MKRVAVGLMTVLALLATAGVVAVDAAPAAGTSGYVGPYEGEFEGVANGDRGSSAALGVDLTHRGRLVAGTVRLGEGLRVNAGFCGTVDIPAAALRIQGQTAASNPRRLVANPAFDVGGMSLSVDFQSSVAADGESVTAQAKVDLPWFCGKDPVFEGTLYRQ